MAIEKDFAGPGLLAYIVTSKFADYLPLYRLKLVTQMKALTEAHKTIATPA